MTDPQNKFQQMIFAALAKQSLRGQGASAFLGKNQSPITPIGNENDHQTGLGAIRSREWQIGRLWAPGKTGTSSFQRHKVVIEPMRCAEKTRAGKACSKMAATGRLTCTVHGSRGRNRGREVELRLEEVPMLPCDR